MSTCFVLFITIPIVSCTNKKQEEKHSVVMHLCEQAKTFPWKDYDSTAGIVAAFSKVINDSDETVKKVYNAVSVAANDQKLALFKQGLGEMGIKDFSCVPLEDFISGHYEKLNPKLAKE